MLPQTHRERYRALGQQLEQLQQIAEAPDADAAELARQCQQLEQQFQTDIMALTDRELDPQMGAQWQSLQTEMHRMMRLLRTDVTFLQAARQSALRQKRQASIRDRLARLSSYVEALLQL